MARIILLALLSLNAVMELLGGAMMIARPAQLGRDTFGLGLDPGVMALVPVIGGATVSYGLLSAVTALAVFQRREAGRLLVLLLAAMLALVGVVMLAHGLRVGAVDLLKSALLAAGAWTLQAPGAQLGATLLRPPR